MQRVGARYSGPLASGRSVTETWLDLDPAEDNDVMPQILGSSVSYQIAVGPQPVRQVCKGYCLH